MHLFTDIIERVGHVPVLQLHVHGVAQESQAASGPQHPVGLQEELLPVEPMSCRHGRHKVHLTGGKGQRFCRTLAGVKVGRTMLKQGKM